MVSKSGIGFKLHKMTSLKNVFLVEDDIDDQLFFTEALSEIKHAVLLDIAYDGQEALEKLEKIFFLPDLIFMDINMPGMNGIQCLEEIVKKPVLKEIPIIIISTSTQQVAIAQSLGAKAFIKKPNNVEILRNRLEEIINLDFNKPSCYHMRAFIYGTHSTQN